MRSRVAVVLGLVLAMGAPGGGRAWAQTLTRAPGEFCSQGEVAQTSDLRALRCVAGTDGRMRWELATAQPPTSGASTTTAAPPTTARSSSTTTARTSRPPTVSSPTTVPTMPKTGRATWAETFLACALVLLGSGLVRSTLRRRAGLP